eukprot:1141770-Amphidinium_carterae.1
MGTGKADEAANERSLETLHGSCFHRRRKRKTCYYAKPLKGQIPRTNRGPPAKTEKKLEFLYVQRALGNN